MLDAPSSDGISSVQFWTKKKIKVIDADLYRTIISHT